MPDVRPEDFGGVPIQAAPRPEDFGAVPIAKPPLDHAAANNSLAKNIGNAIAPSLKPEQDVGVIHAGLEAFANASTGLLFGFPAKFGAATAAVAQKYALGMDIDPKELSDTISSFFTYMPRTARGQEYAGNVMLPLTKLDEHIAEPAGQAVTRGLLKLGATDDFAAYSGAFTQEAINFVPGILLGSLLRRMSGKTPTPDDFSNTAKVLAAEPGAVSEEALRAGAGVKPAAATEAPLVADQAKVQAIEDNLRTTYLDTGIDPFTVAQIASGDSAMQQQLAKQGAGTPEAITAKIAQEAPGAVKKAGDALALPDEGSPAPAVAAGLEPIDLAGPNATEVKAGVTPEPPVRTFAEINAENFAKSANGKDSPEMRESIIAMKDEIGAMETGGRMIARNDVDGIGGGGMEVLGRTGWVGNKWWFGRADKLSAAQALRAIDKYAAGKKLGKREQGLIDTIRYEVEDRMGIGEYAELQEKERIAAVELADTTPEYSGGDWGKLTEAEKNAELDQIFGPSARTDVADSKGGKGTVPQKDGQKVSPEGTPEEIANKEFQLAQQTEADLKAQAAAESALASAEKQDLARAQADAQRAGFTLTGSDRVADVGAAAGQGDLLDLHAGINLRAAAKAYAEMYTPFVGVDLPKGVPSGGIVDSLYKVISPSSRGIIAETEAGIMRSNLGKMARERELAVEQMKKFAAEFDKLPVQDNYDFIDAMERGAQLPPGRLADAARAIRDLLDQKRMEVQALGKGQLDNFIENYFPHIWRDSNAAQSFYARRPLSGSGAFLKERSYDFFSDGLAAGLEPVSVNPIELALLKAREMDRYVYGQRIFEEMKATGLARFVRFGDRAPPGWVKINDKIARVFQYSEDEAGMIMRGEYWAPDQAGTLINNHLSPGLQGHGAFDAWRGIGMMMNSVQLGLSAFHVGFTTLDAMVSKVALGVKQAARGDVFSGLGNIVAGVTPTQPFINIYRGDRLLRAYLGNLNDPSLAPVVDAIMDAGGRVRMDDFYRNATVNGFKQAIRTDNWTGAAKAFLPTLLDRVNAPIFEQLVPRQKLGVFSDLAKDWIKENPNASPQFRRAELAKLWDSVDNRMGQLVYDNVFWNRTLKDALMATVRSVGWNLGTFREIGGGVKDIKDIAKIGGLSDRTAYVIALPFVAAIYGAVTQYAYTGEGPRELKDMYFPRTGKIRPDGSEDRVSLPTYMKDVYAYGEDVTNFLKYGSDPLTTIENKAHPLIATVAQMLANEDFYGATIRNPSAPAVAQLQDEAQYLIKQFSPFSLRNYQQQAKLAGEDPNLKGYLTTPSMIGITPAPGYIAKSPEEETSTQVSKLRDPLMKKFRQEIKDGADPGDVIQKMIAAGFSKNDIHYVVRTSGDVQRPHRLKTFRTEE